MPDAFQGIGNKQTKRCPNGFARRQREGAAKERHDRPGILEKARPAARRESAATSSLESSGSSHVGMVERIARAESLATSASGQGVSQDSRCKDNRLAVSCQPPSTDFRRASLAVRSLRLNRTVAGSLSSPSTHFCARLGLFWCGGWGQNRLAGGFTKKGRSPRLWWNRKASHGFGVPAQERPRTRAYKLLTLG
jgi:hypothetical protein